MKSCVNFCIKFCLKKFSENYAQIHSYLKLSYCHDQFTWSSCNLIRTSKKGQLLHKIIWNPINLQKCNFTARWSKVCSTDVDLIHKYHLVSSKLLQQVTAYFLALKSHISFDRSMLKCSWLLDPWLDKGVRQHYNWISICKIFMEETPQIYCYCVYSTGWFTESTNEVCFSKDFYALSLFPTLSMTTSSYPSVP